MLPSPQLQLTQQSDTTVRVSVLVPVVGHAPAPPGEPLPIHSPGRKVPEQLLSRSAEGDLQSTACGCGTISDLFTLFCETGTYLVAQCGFFLFPGKLQINSFAALVLQMFVKTSFYVWRFPLDAPSHEEIDCVFV